ncbi:hypothetical protein [Photobacterium sp. R1]
MLYLTATKLSPDNGKIIWRGQEKGDAIENSYIMDQRTLVTERCPAGKMGL